MFFSLKKNISKLNARLTALLSPAAYIMSLFTNEGSYR